VDTIIQEAVDDFRDSVATMDRNGKRIWMFPQKPKGKLYNARTLVAWSLLVVFFGMPFIKINGEPLFLLDVVSRKFVLFNVVFYPQDFFLFGLMMITIIVFIVLFTVAFGRLWCGWACPQTIFMEMLFRKIEYLIDGDSNQQKALSNSSWTREKIFKRALKYTIFYSISFVISLLFLSYLRGIDRIFELFTTPFSSNIPLFISLVIFSFIFFFVFAWFREQACIVVCPYGRLQGVLLDRDSIVVAYDHVRGEPRSKFKKVSDPNAGDCIDCRQCVKVCPTGIDIRFGTQLECINCTACIDACDFMMEKVKRPKGLIRLASENNIAEGKKTRFTPRLAGYATVLVLLVTGLAIGLAMRKPVETKVLRMPGMLYQEQPDHRISNLYTVKIINKGRKNITAVLKVESGDGELKMIGKDSIDLQKGNVTQAEFFLILDREQIKSRKTKVRIGVYNGAKKLQSIDTNFMGPVTSKTHG
jgi:cytochrome c oxidase accessory protein FixG